MMEALSLINPVGILKAVNKWFHRSRPTVDFEYGLGFPENDYCQFRVDKNTHTNCLFFRLGINNTGKTRIDEADVRVEKIEIIDTAGKRQKVRSSPFFLHWANEDTDNSRSIYFNTPVFIDLIFTNESRHGMAFFFFKGKHKSSGIKEFLTPGKWVVTIKLLGREIVPIEKEVLIDFDGRWNQIRLELRELSKN